MHALTTIMWEDTRRRIDVYSKEVGGVRASSAIPELYEQHLAMVHSYEMGIYADDYVLARVLFNNLFVDKRNVTPTNLALLVEYTRKSVQMLDKVSSLHLLTNGNVVFPRLLEPSETDSAPKR